MELAQIKGIKEKRLEQLKSVGIYTPMDLLSYFPNKYVDLYNLTDFRQVKNGDDVLFCVVFSEKPKTAFVRKNLTITKVKFDVQGQSINCTWFNQKYFAGSVILGVQYYVIGRAKINGKFIDVVNPKIVRKDKCNSRFLIFYKPIKNMSSAVIESAVKEVLKSVTIHSFISDSDAEKHGLMNLNNAYRTVHCPQDSRLLGQAKRSIAIEYLSYTLSVYSIIKQQTTIKKERKYGDFGQKIADFVAKLPFELTEDQSCAVKEIIYDMRNNFSMNRLLQGDVGCGKTIVAIVAIYFAFLNGYQSVMMCPTELLARQHLQTAIKFLSEYGVKICLLSSSLKTAERNEIRENIKRGNVDLIVGTHAVFSSDIEFNNLAFIITDEQHRFGVNQRSSLENKAVGADCLVMSATPIPRTLALTLYGDLKQSYIKTLPKNKAEISTKIVPEYKYDDMWKYFVDCANKDMRTYIVCARIDEDDDGIESVKGLFKQKKHLYDKMGILHGQMSDVEKDNVMSKFASGEIRILISTTVIEVGIDVPEATNIAVYNAERYGLSQLHQLRGRVGRGSQKGYCFLISDTDCADSAKERLEFLTKCSDGFKLAEYDFAVRGAGDFLGNSQHGKNGNFAINAENIAISKQISDNLLANTMTRTEIVSTINDNKYSYFKNITLN